MTKEQKELNDELIEASYYGRLEEVKELIEKGAEVAARNQGDQTPLQMASLYGNLEVVKYLIEEAHAEVDAWNRGDQTPLQMASLYGNLEVVKYLMEEAHAEVDARDDKDQTPLHCASREGHVEVVKYLFLERNALMPISELFYYSELMKEKVGRKTEAQNIFDYFLQNKSKYTVENIQYFKKRFLDFLMTDEDSKNLKSIVKFL